MQSELLLELGCECLELLDVLPGMMDLQGSRMDLAHRDVKVLVLLIAVAHCNVVVLLKTGCLDGATHHELLLPFIQRTVIGVKRDDQVIGLVTFGAAVATLVGLDDLDRRLRIFASIQAFEVSRHEPRAALGPLTPKHVLNEPSEPGSARSLALRLERLRLDDHTRSASRPIRDRSCTEVCSSSTSVRLAAPLSTAPVIASLRSPPSRFCSA